MFVRFMEERLLMSLEFSPITYLAGPRQAGKSTLAKMMGVGREFLSLDNIETLISAQNQPRDFIMERKGLCVIDEIQRAPELILPIKESVDNHKIPGQFLLTGSANLLNIPTLSDSLAGRMILLNLLPLSAGEIMGKKNSWLQKIFSEKIGDIFQNVKDISYEDICKFIVNGGYPIIWQDMSAAKRDMWFESYIGTMIERDLRDITNFVDVMRMHRLFSDLALRSASIINVLEVARKCQIPAASVTLYMAALESIFLTSKIPCYFTNLHKRLVKAPKFYLNDTGILCNILRITEDTNFVEKPEWGGVLETFIYNEIKKQLSWSSERIDILHYRTYDGKEVDFVLENGNRDIIGIEVKASKNITEHFTHGLKHLQNEVGAKFKG